MNQEVIPPDKEFYWDVVNKPGEYYYVVAAVDLAGNEAYSGAIIAHVRDVIPPKPPTNLKTETDSGKVMLRWDPSPDNDLMGYVIYKVIEGEEFHPEHYTLINDVPVKETNYIEELHKNVKTAFRYVVEAVDTSYNRSVFSTFSVARLPDHLPPVSPFIRNVTLAENGNEIVIEWEANKDDDIYGYNLFRVDGTDSLAPKNILNLAPFLKSELKYSDEAISPGTKYTYFLQALDSSRNISDWSNGFSALVPGKSVSDGIKLKSFSAKMRGAKTVDLKWKANDPEHVLGYVIFRKEGDNNFMPLTGTLEEGKYKDKSVKSGLVYQYQVRMYASDGGIVKSENKEFKIPDDEK